MSKKVYFTQEQMKHIMGEDFGGAYLDKTSTPGELHGGEPLDIETLSTEPGGEPKTLDAYGNQKIANNMWTRRGNGYSLYEDKKKLNERNAELDGNKLYALPPEVRKLATQDGIHNEIMARLNSGEKMDIASLYRVRNELQDSQNSKIKKSIDTLIKRAQMQGASLRNTHADNEFDFNTNKSALPGKGHRKEGNTKIYYEKD